MADMQAYLRITNDGSESCGGLTLKTDLPTPVMLSASQPWRVKAIMTYPKPNLRNS